MASSREESVRHVAGVVLDRELDHPLRVAVDGITASGKSTFADELAGVIAQRRPVIRLTMDGYHHDRERRYRQGRLSAEGYYEDAYDFAAFADNVLRPLGPGGDRKYRRRLIDLASDASVDEPPRRAQPDAVLVVDGSFLQRPEICDLWDVRIFVDTSFDEARRRGVARDAELLGGEEEASHLYDVRYHAAARRYRAQVRPQEIAHVRVANDDLDAPTVEVVRGRGLADPDGRRP